MIISASRRTDIPAFYSDWFMNRIKAGFCHVRNPINNKISEISLKPDIIDCIVFWTKNPSAMLHYLDDLKDYNYYFQFTITPYGNKIERKVPSTNYLIKVMQDLSKKIGKEKVVWRYDPIFISKDISIQYHVEHFKQMAQALDGYVEKCVISFLDNYQWLPELSAPSEHQIKNLTKQMASSAFEHGIQIETCSELVDISENGILYGKCIDDKMISRIVGQKLSISKDKGQRQECGCVTSIDIGAYDTCKHNCVYCYAKRVDVQLQKHYPDSTLIIGKVKPTDEITVRKMEKYQKDFVEQDMFE